MKEEEKQLLLKDLCARLPYGVQCEFWGHRYRPYTFTGNDIEDLIAGRTFKPYLRPMSSMTEEERKELSHYENSVQRTDFFYSHHIDCRFMIEKGLALEAPEDMYKTE